MAPDNLDAPWLNFEAGALSKAASDEFVCPYLLNVALADLKPPIAQFQAQLADRAGTHKLLKTINAALRGDALTESTLDKVFEKWWPDLEHELARVSAAAANPPARRDQNEILDEVLNLLRAQERRYALEQQRLEASQKFSEALSKLTLGNVISNSSGSLFKTEVGSSQFRGYLADLLKQGSVDETRGDAVSDTDSS